MAKEPPIELPPKALLALEKVKKVILKDGSVAKLTLSRSDSGVSVHATMDGIEFFIASLHLSPNSVAPPPSDPDEWDQYKDDRGSWSATNVSVDTDFRRKGLATAMYDYAARLGFKILPSGRGYGGKLLPNGRSLWQSREKPIRFGRRPPKQDRFWKPKAPR